MTKVSEGPVTKKDLEQLKELGQIVRDNFKVQAFDLTKLGIKFEVERDAKQWPVSVTFKKSLPGAKLQIHVTREHGEPKFGVTQNDDGKIVDMYKVIQGGIEYEWKKNEICGGYFSHQIYVPDERLDDIKTIIFEIDKEPKMQLFHTLELLIPEVISDINKTREGKFVTENPWYVEKGKEGIEIMEKELKRMLRISTKIMQELV